MQAMGKLHGATHKIYGRFGHSKKIEKFFPTKSTDFATKNFTNSKSTPVVLIADPFYEL